MVTSVKMHCTYMYVYTVYLTFMCIFLSSVIRRSFSARPSSVPVSSQWDENVSGSTCKMYITYIV